MVMSSESMSKGKMLALVIVVAVVAAVLAAVIQVLVLGKSNAAVTGGVVGALTAGIAVTLRNKKSA
jgi:flagellar basal body-associated protein FliL